MDTQFVFTPADVYRTLLALCGFVVAIAGATKIIVDVINKAKKPEKTQNERISALESRVTALENRSNELWDFQKQAEEAMVLNMEALMDIMNHMIYGNHTENLKATQQKMQAYMAKYAFKLKGERI